MRLVSTATGEDDCGGIRTTPTSEDGSHHLVAVRSPTDGIESFHVWPILPEREADPHAPCKRLVLLSDPIDVLLLLPDLGVLGHVFWRGEVIIVPGIDFRIEGGHERGLGGTEVVPFDAVEEGMACNLRQRRVPHAGMGNQPGLRESK